MKTPMLISIITGLLCWNLPAQTADDWVNQGRLYLTAHNTVAANTNFAQALIINPNHQTANALYAITRILVLPSESAGSNFLTRVGLPASGRNIYSWTAMLPKDSHGLLAPNGVNANEFTAQLRTNALPAIIGAVGNLSLITDTNFTVNLSSSETDSSAVTVDYGDLKLIQAGLYGAEYLIYTLNAQNVNAQLTAIRTLYTNETLSAQRMLASYPQLLTFATTNDLQAARVVFTNAVNSYTAASGFIRNRSTNQVRLFNYDQVSAPDEADFRSVLQDLKTSLAGAQILTVKTNLTMNFGTQFTGKTTWRSLLPKFDGNGIELGSLPDLTFGGLIYGLADNDTEGFLSGYFRMLPVGSPPSFLSSNSLKIPFTTLGGHYYVLEASTNLLNWQFVTSFTATNTTSTLIDLQSVKLFKRFYRLRDDTGFLAFAGVVLDQNTGLPIAHAQISSLWDGATAFSDTNGQFYLSTSVPSDWYADELEISAAGYITFDNYYYGSGLVSGLQIYLSSPPANDNFASRITLTGSSVSTSGNNSGASFENGEPYDTYYYSGYGYKSVWFSWTAPTTGSYVISVSAASAYNPILGIYTGSQLSSLATVTDLVGSGYYAGYTISAVAGRTYQIEIDDYNQQGGTYNLSIGH